MSAPWTDEQKELLAYLWGQRWLVSEIADEVGHPIGSTSSQAKKLGLPSRNKLKPCARAGCNEMVPKNAKYCNRECYAKAMTGALGSKRCSECRKPYRLREGELRGNYIKRKTCSPQCSRARSRRMHQLKRKKSEPQSALEKEAERCAVLYQKYTDEYGGPCYRYARRVETVKYRVM